MKLVPSPYMMRLCDHDGCNTRIKKSNFSGFCALHFAHHKMMASAYRCNACGVKLCKRAKSGKCWSCLYPRNHGQAVPMVRIMARSIAKALLISERDILSTQRTSLCIAGRVALAMILRERGYSQSRVAAAMGLMEHSSVSNMIKRYPHFAALFPAIVPLIEHYRGMTVPQILGQAPLAMAA